MRPTQSVEFRPGFRLSLLDVLILLVGASAAAVAADSFMWLAFVISMAVGHFFLFCNVFRIARNLEFIWAAIFVLLAWGTIRFGQPGWLLTTLLTLATTITVIAIEMRKPSYHGIGWSRINPNLREWWESPFRS